MCKILAATLLLLTFLSEKRLNYALEVHQIIICPGKGKIVLSMGLDELRILLLLNLSHGTQLHQPLPHLLKKKKILKIQKTPPKTTKATKAENKTEIN